MPSTYSDLLRLELQENGSNAGLWGEITNRNLGDLLEDAIAGTVVIAMADSNLTLSTANGAVDQSRYAAIEFTGTLTATRDITVPSTSKLYRIKNSTNQSLNVKTAAGSGRIVAAGRTTNLIVESTGVFTQLDSVAALFADSLSVSGAVVLGDAAGDTVTINGTAVSIPNGLNFDSNTLVIDSTNNSVGIGTSVPFTLLGGSNGLAINHTGSVELDIAVSGSRRGYFYADTTIVQLGTVSGALAFTTGLTERLRIDTAGNAGLGVTPSAWSLGKAFEVGSAGNALWGVNNSDVYMSSNAYFDGAWKYAGSNRASTYQQQSGIHYWFTAPSGTAGNPITFTQAMTLTQGGNLLVGTTSDESNIRFKSRLDSDTLSSIAIENNNVSTSASITEKRILIGVGGPSSPVPLWINRSYIDSATSEGFAIGTAASSPLILSTNRLEAARITSARYFKASNTGNYSLPNGSTHEFNSNQNATTLNVANGNTGSSVFNYVSQLATGSAGFHFIGDLNGSIVYQVLANGNVQNTNNSYGAISDIKLKENIQDATPKLDGLNQLRVVNYNLKGDDLKQIGLIAQEVEQIFPGLVDETPDTIEVTKTRIVEVPAVLDEEGNEVTPATTRPEEYTEREPNGEVTKSVKYSVLVPMLLKGMQEQQAMIQSLMARVEALEAK